MALKAAVVSRRRSLRCGGLNMARDIFGLGQLAHINRVWLDYYHTKRPHQGTGNNIISVDFRRTSTGKIKREERLGGIVAWDEREVA